MSTTITRLYATDKNAMEAVGALKKLGFSDEHLNLVVPSADHVGDLLGAIEKGGVPATHARVYAEQVRRGASLVSVRAAFGLSGKATKVLQGFHPIESGVADPDVYEKAQDSNFSNILRSKPNAVLLDSNTYFSNLLGLPLIIKGDKRPTNLLTDQKPFSHLLSGSTTSSWLGIPTLTRNQEGKARTS